MRVLLIHVDGKLPNLALMKISAYHKAAGDEVGFKTHQPERIYASCIFKKNLSQTMGLPTLYPGVPVTIGGPALQKPHHLPTDMEHVMPDYRLYPGMDYSMGYTTRGCPNACPFCIVPQVEGAFTEYAPITEFHDPAHSKIVLLDNNFLASRSWRAKLSYLQQQGLRVSFCQGLDARLVDEEKANALADTRCTSLNFKHRRYYFAWDLMPPSQQILRGLGCVISAGIKPRDIMVYILCGFNTSHQEDYGRYSQLRAMGIDPFVMKFNNKKSDPWLNHFARWVNKRIYKSCRLSDYSYMPEHLRNEV